MPNSTIFTTSQAGSFTFPPICLASPLPDCMCTPAVLRPCQIKLASLIPVVNAYGEIMTKGETVTLFNDMCVLAPGTLIAKSIQWETIDPLTVKATFTNQGYTISALSVF